MDQDRVIELAGALVQHGPGSDRVYIMDPGTADPTVLVRQAESLALREGYGKIFSRVPAFAAEPFQVSGYILEASVPDMYGPLLDGYFLRKFLEAGRMERSEERVEARIRARALVARAEERDVTVQAVSRARLEDLPLLAALYAEVFPVYPFPIQDPAFLREEQGSGAAVYFLIREAGRIIAAGSYEPDRRYGYAEMTDFATLPEARGRGLASALLQAMEAHARETGIRVAYTIARAESASMNLVFGRAGYTYGGVLVNNTLIGRSIESMHVWHRQLA